MAVIGVFGTIPFVASSFRTLTFSDLSRSLSTRWSEHQVIGSKPVLEWTGDALAQVSMSIRFDSSLGLPPLAGFKLLKSALESHTARVLVIGASYWGKFVLEKVDEEHKFFNSFGGELVGTASITLKEFDGGWA